MNKRANRVSLNSMLKCTIASFPVKLLGQGRIHLQFSTPASFFHCFQVLSVADFDHVRTSDDLIVVIGITGCGQEMMICTFILNILGFLKQTKRSVCTCLVCCQLVQSWTSDSIVFLTAVDHVFETEEPIY